VKQIFPSILTKNRGENGTDSARLKKHFEYNSRRKKNQLVKRQNLLKVNRWKLYEPVKKLINSIRYFYEKGNCGVRNEIEWLGFKTSGGISLYTLNFTLLSELGIWISTNWICYRRVVFNIKFFY